MALTISFPATYPAFDGTQPCVDDPDLFFPSKGDVGHPQDAAKNTCRRCPFVVDCGAYAVATDEKFGIWGGLTERERSRIRRGRAA